MYFPASNFSTGWAFKILNGVYSEKDLGIMISKTLNLYNRGNQRLGLLKRTCHFVTHQNKRRLLHLTMVNL